MKKNMLSFQIGSAETVFLELQVYKLLFKCFHWERETIIFAGLYNYLAGKTKEKELI